MPLERIDPSRPELFQHDAHWTTSAACVRMTRAPFGERPVRPYWSITKFRHIMEIDGNHQDFSSEPGITLADRPLDFQTTNFISMDPPKHDVQRRTVQGVVAPTNLAKLESTIGNGQRASWMAWRPAKPSTGWTVFPSS